MTELSTAALCFLFADRIDGYDPSPTNAFLRETDAPQVAGFDRRWWVQASLEIVMVRLRDLEIVELTQGIRVDGVRPGPVVGVRGVAPPRPLPPLDAEIAGRLLSDTDVLNAMAGTDYNWFRGGFRGWLGAARDEAVQAGLGKSTRGFVGRIWNGGDAHEWNREAINRHWEAFWGVHEGWRRFRAEDPELAQLLAADISTGLVEAIPSDGW